MYTPLLLKVALAVCAALCTCVAAGSLHCGDSVYCAQPATCCGSRSGAPATCCPIARAICCDDGLTCCPHSAVCDSKRHVCIQITNSTRVQTAQAHDTASAASDDYPNQSFACSPGCDGDEPCCTEAGTCCPFPHGVCCADARHCCPLHSHCDLHTRQCTNVGHTYPKINRTSVGIPLLDMTTFDYRSRKYRHRLRRHLHIA